MQGEKTNRNPENLHKSQTTTNQTLLLPRPTADRPTNLSYVQLWGNRVRDVALEKYMAMLWELGKRAPLYLLNAAMIGNKIKRIIEATCIMISSCDDN